MGVRRDFVDVETGNRVRDMKNTWSAVTGSIGVDFTPTMNTLIYARASRGYRPGGFNAGFLYDPPQVEEETVDSGYKGTLLDQLQLSTVLQALPTTRRTTCRHLVNTVLSCSIPSAAAPDGTAMLRRPRG